MNILSRKEAKVLESNTYYTGVPCKNGHISVRYTQSGTCRECINGPRRPRPPAAESPSVNLVDYRATLRHAKFDLPHSRYDEFRQLALTLLELRYPEVPVALLQFSVKGAMYSNLGLYIVPHHPDDAETLWSTCRRMCRESLPRVVSPYQAQLDELNKKPA